ncbi:MAG: WbqC family protein [Planctomycetes bacterium]|uniref:WbqC family protein n=1 Tax=Candidatus Wunengus californicus TaxID=3367619 RepID=UPI004026681F|nr:WbqC family protein [Planctomycetota bacterium]
MFVAIHQPQYLLWIGYFDKLDRADVFMLLDNVRCKKTSGRIGIVSGLRRAGSELPFPFCINTLRRSMP